MNQRPFLQPAPADASINRNDIIINSLQFIKEIQHPLTPLSLYQQGQPPYITPLMMAVSKLGTQGGGGGRIPDPLLQRNMAPISNSFNDPITRLEASAFSFIVIMLKEASALHPADFLPSLQFQYVKTIYSGGRAAGKSGKWRNLLDSISTRFIFTLFFPLFLLRRRRNLAGK